MQSDELKDAGLKATQPRLKILSVLEQNRDRHMSAEDVYRALMTTGDDLGLADDLPSSDTVRVGRTGHPASFRGRACGIRARLGRAP